LEQFLDQFQGALVVVSHDRYFLDRNVDFLMSFEEGVLGTRYPAPYETYQQLREQEVAAAEPARKSASSVNKPAAKSNNRPRKLTWKEQRELEAAEAAIETLTEKVAILAAEINDIGSDYERLQPLVDELEQSKAALETAEFRWLELTEIAENS
jgi:ATP-binding cassette subfamily F protein uup